MYDKYNKVYFRLTMSGAENYFKVTLTTQPNYDIKYSYLTFFNEFQSILRNLFLFSS